MRPLPLSVAASLFLLVASLSTGLAAQLALYPAAAAILVLPGYLLLTILDRMPDNVAGAVVTSVAVSVASLMLIGLALNTALPLVGLSEPLGRPQVLIATIAMLAILAVIADRATGSANHPASLPVPQGWIAWLLLGAFLVLAAVVGAVVLNHQGSNWISLGTVVLVPVIALWFIIRGAPRADWLAAFMLFAQGLALLFLTSLRSFYLSGHDILHEYQVYEVTLHHERWSPWYIHDAYSACLSLTILPTILHQLLGGISGQYIFRGLYQVLFALTPVAIFAIARRFLGRRAAYASAFAFLFAPALTTDMTYITRQAIALLFFAVFLLVLLDRAVRNWQRTVLLTTLGFGLVASHYATADIGVVIISLAVVARFAMRVVPPVLPRIAHLSRRLTSRRPTESEVPYPNATMSRQRPGSRIRRSPGPGAHPPAVSLAVALALLAGVVIWQIPITRSTGNLNAFLSTATQGLGSNGSVVGGDTAYPIRLGGFLDRANQSSQLPPAERYRPTQYSSYNAALQVPEDIPSVLPATETHIITTGGTLVDFTAYLLMIVGCGLLVVWGLTREDCIDVATLSAGSLVVVLVASISPAVSNLYSPLRVYQQSLVLLGPAAVIALVALSRRFAPRLFHPALAGLFAIIFVVNSPLMSQYLNAPHAAIALNNKGLYYDLYYTHSSDVMAVNWLRQHTTRADVINADFYVTRRLTAFGIAPDSIVSNVLPSHIAKSAYVFADVDNTTRSVAFDFSAGIETSYRFPLTFLRQHKRVVYTDGQVEIFH